MSFDIRNVYFHCCILDGTPWFGSKTKLPTLAEAIKQVYLGPEEIVITATVTLLSCTHKFRRIIATFLTYINIFLSSLSNTTLDIIPISRTKEISPELFRWISRHEACQGHRPSIAYCPETLPVSPISPSGRNQCHVMQNSGKTS